MSDKSSAENMDVVYDRSIKNGLDKFSLEQENRNLCNSQVHCINESLKHVNRLSRLSSHSDDEYDIDLEDDDSFGIEEHDLDSSVDAILARAVSLLSKERIIEPSSPAPIVKRWKLL